MDTKRVLVVGGGTMGADVAVVFLRAGHRVTVVEPNDATRELVTARVSRALEDIARASLVPNLTLVRELDEACAHATDGVVECIPERLDVKRALFARLVSAFPATTWLASNSSSYPISQIGAGLATQQRMVGLHFFMPAHLVPLVEVVLGPQTDPAVAQDLAELMRQCGSVPVVVRKDKPGFLANRLQHALAREAFALIDEGVASPEDVDKAVRFGFGFRFLAAGPVLQRDHAGLEVHTAAAASIYPSLAANTEPAQALRERVAQGKLGMKTGEGFYRWDEDTVQAERQRYQRVLQAGLSILASELPPLPPLASPCPPSD